MPEVLEYESSQNRSRIRPSWTGVAAASSLVGAFVAMGIAALASQGPLPGELPMASALTVLATVCWIITVSRTRRKFRQRAWTEAVFLSFVCLAAILFVASSVWELIHTRW
jgi:drug/metabolite transporter (DMT)-like permease